MNKKRLIVGMSGASGTPLAIRVLQTLQAMPDVETHLVATESEMPFEQIIALADVYYEGNPIDAAIASGTFKTAGMLVVPCSMKSVAGIANGFSENLLLRAADVCVKEKRTLVLAARETPLSPIHLHNLQVLAALANVHIMPPMMTWYMNPKSIDEMEHHLVAKMLAPFGIDVPAFHWGE